MGGAYLCVYKRVYGGLSQQFINHTGKAIKHRERKHTYGRNLIKHLRRKS